MGKDWLVFPQVWGFDLPDQIRCASETNNVYICKMQYRITFLGTGTSTGVPLIGCRCNICTSEDKKDKRLRSSVLVEVLPKNGEVVKILIDAGPDFRQQMLTHNVTSLDAILLTHEHWDHVAGLDDVRAFNFLSKRPVPVYAEPRVLKSIKKDFSYAFTDCPFPGLPEMDLHSIDNGPFAVAGVPIVPVRALHDKLPVFGFRIGPFGYLTDANHIEENELNKYRGVEVFVVSTVLKTPHRSHFSLQEAIDVARNTGAPNAFLTHMSHRLGPHETFQKELPQGISPAYDGLVVELQR